MAHRGLWLASPDVYGAGAGFSCGAQGRGSASFTLGGGQAQLDEAVCRSSLAVFRHQRGLCGGRLVRAPGVRQTRRAGVPCPGSVRVLPGLCAVRWRGTAGGDFPGACNGGFIGDLCGVRGGQPDAGGCHAKAGRQHTPGDPCAGAAFFDYRQRPCVAHRSGSTAGTQPRLALAHHVAGAGDHPAGQCNAVGPGASVGSLGTAPGVVCRFHAGQRPAQYRHCAGWSWGLRSRGRGDVALGRGERCRSVVCHAAVSRPDVLVTDVARSLAGASRMAFHHDKTDA